MTNTDLLTLIFVAIISAGLAGLIAYDIARNHYIKKLATQIEAKTAHKGDTAKWLAEMTTAQSGLKEVRDILADYESHNDTRHGCPGHCLSLSTCNKQCSERQAPDAASAYREAAESIIETMNELLVDAEVDEPAGRGAGYRIEFNEPQAMRLLIDTIEKSFLPKRSVTSEDIDRLRDKPLNLPE